LLIVATPALIRTLVVGSRQDQTSAGPGLAVVGTFLSSLGIATMVGLASFVAFFATCFVVCLGGLTLGGMDGGGSGDWLLYISVSAGLVPGLFVAFLLFRYFWATKG